MDAKTESWLFISAVILSATVFQWQAWYRYGREGLLSEAIRSAWEREPWLWFVLAVPAAALWIHWFSPMKDG